MPTSFRRSIPLAAVAALLLATGASAQQKTVPVFENGQAQIVPGFADSTQWIREHLWVETEFDSDGDGKKDRVHVDVTRQRQTATEGLRVATLYESSPYFAGTSGPRTSLWDVKQEVGATPPQRVNQPQITFQPNRTRISNSLVPTWVPRGFAVVHSEAPGTGLSQGCPTVGGAPEELAPKAVVDWLNGRAKGYTTIDGMEEVKATWATGRVGMTGTSYNGTIPVAAATTGVKGLDAIIPVAPNTSYWHYYRSNGLVRHPGGWLGEDIDFLYDFIASGDPAKRAYCIATYRDGAFAKGRDRATGDYNAFWAERDLGNKVKGIKAATLMAHAFNDWNVVPEHSVRISEALKKQGVPLQQYFHQGGHGGNPPMEMMNKWFTRYLYDVQNGVEKDPKAWIVRENAAPPAGGRGTGAPTPYADYPNPGAKPVTLYPMSGGLTAGALAPAKKSGQGREILLDDVAQSGADLAKAEKSANRLLYATPVLTEPVHLSGVARVTVRIASSKPAANLSVWLVALPWTEPVNTTSLITRGWADLQNAKSITKSAPLVPGEFVEMSFDLQPDDQIIAAGKRIALMVMSSDKDFTLWPQPGTALTLELDATKLTLPVVGGAAAFAKATGGK